MARSATRPGARARGMRVGDYLLARLYEHGARHIFGVPGDFILPFYDQITASDVALVSTCNELNAGYAADGYARLCGLGAAAVTYGVGALSAVNAVAGAFAEDVPLVLVSGAPPRADYLRRSKRHHVLEDRYEATVAVFEPITVWARALLDAEQASAQIDAALALCLSRNKPVYLEIPSDVQVYPCRAPREPLPVSIRGTSDRQALAECVQEVGERLAVSRSTVIMAGHGVQREGLERKVRALVEETDLAVASLFSGKADYLEHLPQCIGPYQGAGSPPVVRRHVERADLLLCLGTVGSDFNLGAGTAKLSNERLVRARGGQVHVGNHLYPKVTLTDFVDALRAARPRIGRQRRRPRKHFLHSAARPYRPRPSAAMTNKRFYDRIAHFLRAGDQVLADAGCSVNALYIEMPERVRYFTQGYWASIGYGFAASLGAGFAVGALQRVIALEGDGSFQMTAQELSTMVRYDRRAIVFLVNNKGYTAERLIHDGPYNDVASWKYYQLPETFGGLPGIEVRTEGEFEQALAAADAHEGPGPLLIEVHIDPWDASEAFERMSAELRVKR